MRARVFNRIENRYFISEVFAVINTGYYERHLVNDRGNLGFIDYLDKSTCGKPLPVDVNIISYLVNQPFWFVADADDLRVFNKNKNVSDPYTSLRDFKGYRWVFEDAEHLERLMAGGIVPARQFGEQCISVDTRLRGWNHIEIEEDVRKLMSEFHSFHDAVIRSMHYTSGSGKSEYGIVVSDYIRQASGIFDSEWSDSIEVVFDGLLRMNLCPAGDNYISSIYSASIFIENSAIRFCTWDANPGDENSDGTWIHSLGMRWRYLPEVEPQSSKA